MGFIDRVKGIARITDHINIDSAKNHIISNIDFKGPNVWILAFAIIIASVGLNVNSIPVIIGAMLISPLMGPIMGVGLALGINDTSLLKKSLTNLVIMTAISIKKAGTMIFHLCLSKKAMISKVSLFSFIIEPPSVSVIK